VVILEAGGGVPTNNQRLDERFYTASVKVAGEPLPAIVFRHDGRDS